MATKCIVFFVLVFACIQFSSAQQYKPTEEEVLRKVTIEAEKLIKALNNHLLELNQYHKNDLDERIFNIEKIVKDEIERIEKAIKGEVVRIKKAINAAIQAVEQLGINVKNCVVTGVNELEALPGRTVKEVKSCATDKIAEAKAIVEDTKQAIEEAYKSIANLKENLEACLKKWNPVKCVKQVIEDTTNAVGTVPNEIKENVNKALLLIQNLKSDLEKCALQKFLDAIHNLQKIPKDTTDCISNALKISDL